jgi:hypothetical protein
MQKQKSLSRRIFGCLMLVAAVVCVWAEYAVVAPVFLGALGISAWLD